MCEGPISGFVLKQGAFGTDALCSVFYDEVQVRNVDGSYNFNVSGQGYFFDYRLGTPTQTAIVGFDRIENIIPISANNRVANPPVGAGLTKYVVAGFNTATYPDANAVKITLRIPSLLTADSAGNVNGYEIQVAIDISLNNGAWAEQEIVTIRGKCTSPYIKERTYVLPKGGTPSDFYSYKVRVRRVSRNILSTKTSNEIYVDAISVISTNSFRYPNSVVAATEISSDQFSAIPVRAFEVMGLLLNVPDGYVPTTYHADGTITAAQYPSNWNGTWNSTRRWSDNPAWIFFDLVTNVRYGLGAFIPSGYVDKWSLYEIAQYCDELVDDGDGGQEPRFRCNVVIADREDAYQVLQNLVSVFRGMAYWGNGRVFTSQTSDKNPLFNYTNANVVDGQFTYADTSTNVRSTVAMVKWRDPENAYREAVEYREDNEGLARYGYNTKEISAFGCTSRGQAGRIGEWIIQSERLLTETITFRVGLDGLYIRPGDVFNVYDNFRNNSNQGGRITRFNALRNEIHLDRYIDLNASVANTISCVIPTASDLTGVTDVVNANLIHPEQIETKQILGWSGLSGEYTIVTTNTPFSAELFQGSVFVISYTGTGTVFQKASQYKCLATSEPEPGIVEILGLQYHTGINNAAESNYTTVTNPVNPGDNSAISPVTSLTAQIVDGIRSNNTYFRYIKLDWTDTVSTNLSYYIVSGKPFGGSFGIAGTPVPPTFQYTPTVTGEHQFVVIAKSYGGVESTPETVNITIPSTSPVGEPPFHSGIQLIEDYDPAYTDGNGEYTGYQGTTPTVKWTLLYPDGLLHTGNQFITGYKVYIERPSDNFQFYGPKVLEGIENTSFEAPANLFNTGMSGNPIRRVHFYIQSMDEFGNNSHGSTIDIDNPAPRAPFDSGFFAQRGGLNYSIAPNEMDQDISGVYLWYNETGAFVPKFTSPNLKTTNLAGFVTNQQTGLYYVWFSLIDYFGTGGCPIYGPVAVQPNIYITSGEATQMDTLLSGTLSSGRTDVWTFALSDELSPIETGMNVFTYHAPCDAYLYKLRASVGVTGAGTPITLDLRQSGTSLLSTSLTIDPLEETSLTAASSYVISNPIIAANAKLSINMTTVSTGACGLKVTLYVRRNNDI